MSHKDKTRQRDEARREVFDLRARVAELGSALAAERLAMVTAAAHTVEARRERDAARAEVEMHKGLRAETLKANENLRAEVERLRREFDVRAVIERCPKHDAPTLVDGHQKGRVRIVCAECCDEDNERLHEALRGLLDASPGMSGGRWDAARAALAGSPVETRRALAERVREAIAQQLSAYDAPAVRALDLDALMDQGEP